MISGNLGKALPRSISGHRYSFCQLVGAGGLLEATGVAGEGVGNGVDSPAVHDFGDGFEIAVAATGKNDVGYYIAVEIKFYFDRADALWKVCVFHV